MSITYTAQTPTGTVTRTSEGRTYTHAIIALDAQGWGAVAWAGREDLAVKQVAHWSKVPSFTEVRMVPVTVEEKKPRAAKVPALPTNTADFAALLTETLAPVPTSRRRRQPVATETMTKDDIEMIASAVERSQDAIAEKPAKAKTPKAKAAPKAERKSSGMVKGSDEWKAQRKIVQKRRAAGESWAAIAKDLNISGVGLRNRFIDLVEAK